MTNAPKIIIKKQAGQQYKALSDFAFSEQQIPTVKNQKLLHYRKSAWQSFLDLPFPTQNDEAWRRTDIRKLRTGHFHFLERSLNQKPPARFLDPVISGEKRAGQLISGAVKTTCHLDDNLREQGVIFTDFCTAETEFPELLGQVLGEIVSFDEDKFSALAGSLARDGVFLYVPPNTKIDQPLHSLYWGLGEDTAFINHLVIWLDEGAEATFVHESASPHNHSDQQIFHDGIVEILVARNARLNFVELQSWGKNVWSFTRERAKVLSNGSLEWIFGAMGTHLTKNFSDIDLVEPGAMGRISGFYFTSGNQHLDHDTQQNHLAKNTTSDLLYKGALMDDSRSVWQGMIYVAPGAFGTDGYQANRNLVLSKGARADSIPGLEILADDVRCTHGATVGKIDENELFYLLSRGIQEKEAEKLIVEGFFAPIMARIPFEGVQKRFKDAIREKMSER